MTRMFPLIALLLALVVPVGALAGARAPDLNRELVEIFDQDCTDSFNFNEDTDGDGTADADNRKVTTDLDTNANGDVETNLFDTIGEAVDVWANYKADAQTAGTADGWCDAKPWVIRGSLLTGATSVNMFLGPFVLPGQGAFLFWDFDLIGTDYGFRWLVEQHNSPGSIDSLAQSSETLTSVSYSAILIGPDSGSTTFLTEMGQPFPLPVNMPQYLRITTTAPVAPDNWLLDMAFTGVRVDTVETR